jgi:hypothetical protein
LNNLEKKNTTAMAVSGCISVTAVCVKWNVHLATSPSAFLNATFMHTKSKAVQMAQPLPRVGALVAFNVVKLHRAGFHAQGQEKNNHV